MRASRRGVRSRRRAQRRCASRATPAVRRLTDVCSCAALRACAHNRAVMGNRFAVADAVTGKLGEVAIEHKVGRPALRSASRRHLPPSVC